MRNLGSIVAALESKTTTVLDFSDVLRAELVLSISALDHYVHEIVRLGMLEEYRGTRPRTDQFLGFQVSLGGAMDALATIDGETWIESEVKTRNGYRSFQTPDNIATALRLISDVQLWDWVAHNMSMSTQTVKETLRQIVDRGNQIAHEADLKPSPYDERWPIDRRMVIDSIDFIERVVKSIHAVIT